MTYKMWDKEEVLGKKGYSVDEPPSFVANIKLPVDIDRATFIEYCYRTGTVFVIGVDNQFEANIPVSRELIHRIKFPTETYELGSTVLCITDSIYGTSKIVGIFQDPYSEQEIFEENQWRIFKANSDTFVDLDAKGNTGEINFTAHSGGNTGISSNFKFLNNQNAAELNIKVQGDINLDIDNQFNLFIQRGFNVKIEDIDNNEGKVTELKYIPAEGLTFKDEFENEFGTTNSGFLMKIKNGEEFGVSKEGFVYKNNKSDLKKILTDAIDTLVQAIVTTPSGPGSFAPPTTAKLNQIKLDINNLFS